MAYRPIDRPFFLQILRTPKLPNFRFFMSFCKDFLYKKTSKLIFFKWTIFLFFAQVIEDKLYKPYIAWKIYLFSISFNFLYLYEKIQEQEFNIGVEFFFLKKITPPQVSSMTHKWEKIDKICHFWRFSEK